MNSILKQSFFASVLTLITAFATTVVAGVNDVEIQRIRNEISRLNSTRSSIQYDLSRVQSDLRNSQDQARRDKDEARRADEKLDQYNRDYSRAQDHLRTVKANIERERAQKVADIQRLEQSVQNIQTQISNVETRVTILRNEVSQLSSQAKPDQLAVLNSQFSANQSDISKFQAGVDDYNVKLKRMDELGCTSMECIVVQRQFISTRDQLKAKVSDLTAKNQEIQRQISSLQAAIQALASKQRELDQAQSQASGLKAQLPQIQSQLDSARNRPIASESELARAEQDLRSLEGQKPDLERRARDARSVAERSERRVEDFVRSEQSLRSQIRGVDSEISQLEYRLAALQNNNPPPPTEPSGHLAMALVGRSSTYSLDQELSNLRLSKVEVERLGLTSSQLNSAAIIYLFTDTFSSSLSYASTSALENYVRGGGTLVILGEPSKVGLSSLSQVQSGYQSTAANVVGAGRLSGLNVYSSQQKFKVVSLYSTSSYDTEVILKNSSGDTLGVARNISQGQVITLGVFLGADRLDLLVDLERTLCGNSSGSYNRLQFCY